MAGHEEVELLLLLKRTVEGLLISQVPNVWSIYGGLNRLHAAMERIFKHRYCVYYPGGEPDLWGFINGLVWLQPNLATSPTLVLESYRESSHVPPHILNDSALLWLYKSLETHTLSQKLSWLLSDREHLLSCYEKSAFLSQEKFGEAALICLRAIEHNQSSLLTEINPCLYMTTWDHEVQKTHRRCSSYPETLERNFLWLNNRPTFNLNEMGIIASPFEESQEHEGMLTQEFKKLTSTNLETSENLTSCISNSHLAEELAGSALCAFQEKKDVIKVCVDKIKAWNSLPSILDSSLDTVSRERDLTIISKPWLLNRRHSSRSSNHCSGSQTVPSSPYRSLKFVSSTPNKSSASNGKMLDIDLVCSPSKISPSVLQVNYSCLQHTDCLDDSKFNRIIVSSKSSRSKSPLHHSTTPKNIHRKGFRSSLHSKVQIKDSLKTDKTTSELNESLDSAVRKPKEIDIPEPNRSFVTLEINHNQKCNDRLTPMKSLCNHSRRQRPSSSSSCDFIKESPVTNSGTPLNTSRKSFMEDGGSSVQPMSTGFFPRPVEGQSLFSFLSSGQFSRANAELDRENAHFSISEAMIAAIEQVKCNNELQTVSEHDAVDESDEEINHLKQRLRLRRHQRQEERKGLIWGVTLLSDGKTDTTTTDQSVSPLSTSPGTPSDSISTDGVEDMELDDVQNIAELKDSGLSMSMASLYSEAELCKKSSFSPYESVNQESILSAESVALSLIRQFSEKQLPRASDLKWLVSEQEVRQQLLPLPKSWPVNPDEPEEDMRQATSLRGDMEWAPPRPQLIFTPHPNPVRRTLLAKQNYRCAGCGMKVAMAYAHRFRYCEYLGRYFCTGCHSNQMSLIPGRVLTKWDFSRAPVSSFSYRLLDQMFIDPLFNVRDLSPGLYRKARALERCRKLRLQLYYLKDFLFTCRFAKVLKEVLKSEPNHIYSNIDVYSMMDFEQVKRGELASRLQALVSLFIQHVQQCELCTAQGFICELCFSKEIIYPWQVGEVSQCDGCGSCCHTRCRPRPPLPPCPRCKRMADRGKIGNPQDEASEPTAN